MANGRLCAAVYRQSPSGDGSYRYGRVQVCNLNLVVWTNDTQLNSHNAQKHINRQVQVANLNPRR